MLLLNDKDEMTIFKDMKLNKERISIKNEKIGPFIKQRPDNNLNNKTKELKNTNILKTKGIAI